MPHAQKMIHHLKPLLSLGEIHPTNIHQSLELTLRVVAQEGEDGDYPRRGSIEGQFISEDGELLNEFRKGLR